jgi:hypothetical protein
MRISKEGVPCLECGSAIVGPMIPRPLDKCKACPADGRSACRASGLLEISILLVCHVLSRTLPHGFLRFSALNVAKLLPTFLP